MAANTDPRLQNQVIYSIYVRNHTSEGTFRAVIPDLDRIRALGTDIIWLMPIHPIGVEGKKGSLGCPYANRDYRTVNPAYGTMDDFKALVDEIHKRGMKCMIDVVYNHTSPDSVLAQTHPEWFFRDEQGRPSRHVADWWDVVDLDYTHKELWRYQIDTLKMWAEIVDGFRCDVASTVPVAFWRKARQAVERVRPGAIWLGESVHLDHILAFRRQGFYAATDNELFDVESRPGKMSGGYMTSLPSYKAPFIFANWNNTSGDVDVLTHECGHAFEGYVAERDPNVPADLECPAMESAEIHSMAMEFLTAPWHHLLFGKDTEKYALLHAEDSFVFLAYGCAVDEFQHIMYQNPDLTPDQRNAEWLKLEKKYRPWIDFDNLPFYGRGAGWQRQLHIYECPFYYIDYCLSTMAALQFFLLSLDDHKDAWERYLKLVRRAGLASYTELMQTAGLKVPFEEGSVKGIAQQMTRWLEEHQVG
mgnify:CR=1 FL=1